MPNFITNNSTNKNLKKRLLELIGGSEELKFLVGFFYFSGIRELYRGLRNNPNVILKVLVGLNVDNTNLGLIEYGEKTNNLSDEERLEFFFNSVKKTLNSDDVDNEEFYEQIKYFINLIKEDRLIIRKTYNPNHAKLYLFKLESQQIGRRNLFITGSSNLTKLGLTIQDEFNVEISDYGFEDAEDYFDDLWEKGVQITEDNEVKKRLIKLIENETIIKEITPFEAYCLVLKSYLDSFQQKEIGETLINLLEKNGYKPYRYQLDAVQQALAVIDNHNGVVIADVVGLGKSVIASAIAKQLRKRGIVICPPGIIGDKNKKTGWMKYMEEFGLHDWEVRSLGDLESTLEFVKAHDEIEVIIIDEAHRFRNQDTQSYEILKNICRGRIVILLTATPFNNRPADILSLISLFIVPKKSSISLTDDIVNKFRIFKTIFYKLGYIYKNWNSKDLKKRKKAESYYFALFGEKKIDLKKVKARTHYLAKQIRDVIEPITIRRNRLDLLYNPYYKDEVDNLSKVADPKEWFFELTREQSYFYDDIIKEYFGDPDNGGKFKGAIYRPFEYEEGAQNYNDDVINNNKGISKLEKNREFYQQRNLFDFMRRLIVKRFESSFGAFEQSIRNFKKIYEDALDFIIKTGDGNPYKGEYILDRTLLEKIYQLDTDEIEKYLLDYEEQIRNGVYPKKHKRYKIEKFRYKEKFVQDIKSDIELFEKILKKLSSLALVNNDPKSKCLIEKLNKLRREEPDRKVIIFSEYLDTVKYLENKLRKAFGDRLLVISSDLSTSKAEKIYKNFDASYPEQENDHDILLCTDKISEGFNLNRAGIIVNYDIPWNPVRVIQRLGRINRISKKIFDELYIVNFFPTEEGAEIVKSREIAQNKMFLIHNALGEDSKIFDIDEEPTPSGLYQRLQENPDNLEMESLYTKILNIFENIKKEYPNLIKGLNSFPPRIKVAKYFDKNKLLVFFRKSRMYIVELGEKDKKPKDVTLEDVIENIECGPEEKAIPLSSYFWKNYKLIKDYKENVSIAISEQSLERKALNNLQYLIRVNNDNELLRFKRFLRSLREDIVEYGTLSDYTLRRIANIKTDNLEKVVNELKSLMDELGENYLEKEKSRIKELKKEIIIAIENRNKNEAGEL